jgi:acyl dehydratase
MRVTPDRYVTYRYAGASGDFNPIHLDDDFAREVGLPGKILHGLWTMAQVARAQGDPLKLRSLSVQFRGIGVPEQEIVITSTDNGDGTVACEALQGEQRLVRRGRAVLTIR